MNNSIKEKRKHAGLTQDALAEKLSVSRQTVISLEKGKYNPSLQLAFDIAFVFNCTIEEVFEPEEKSN
ncbi:helix-turn-helix transcriptional regulator [Halalkalibacillus halophilus]|uniref:helix-turn-helix transcriptional regulator n=1 Tax=Halalkalibacillus halophilus TaxID=392827 RepID=UPI00040B6083|nr:helix-turn-helix transcriptional regulator [Halalkalibacillus halophilus]